MPTRLFIVQHKGTPDHKGGWQTLSKHYSLGLALRRIARDAGNLCWRDQYRIITLDGKFLKIRVTGTRTCETRTAHGKPCGLPGVSVEIRYKGGKSGR